MGMMRLSDVNKMVSERHGMGTPHNIGIGKTMEEFKKGKLHVGKSKKLVKSRKQAIAIGLNSK